MTRQEIIQRIFEQSEAMKRGMYVHMQSHFRHVPISRAQLEVLSAIRHLQPVSSKEIASQLFLTPGAVSQSVESLEANGYIQRETGADRRIQFLRLSKKGDKLLADIEKKRRVMMEELMSDLTLEELNVWLKVQAQMAERFKAAQGQTSTHKQK